MKIITLLYLNRIKCFNINILIISKVLLKAFKLNLNGLSKNEMCKI